MYRHSAGGWDSDLELEIRWLSPVSKATDLRETVRSHVLEVAGEFGATPYHDV